MVLDAQGQIHHFIYSNLTTELLGAKQLMRASLPKQLFTPERERRQTGKMKTWREEIHKKRGLTPAGGAEACERKRAEKSLKKVVVPGGEEGPLLRNLHMLRCNLQLGNPSLIMVFPALFSFYYLYSFGASASGFHLSQHASQSQRFHGINAECRQSV